MIENNVLLDNIVEGIKERKGKEIKIVDLSKIEYATTQNFIICTGTSSMHVSAIADSVREYVQEKIGRKPYNYDGYQNAQWIVLDYGTIYVHIFLTQFRELYDLEHLWNDVPILEVPDED